MTTREELAARYHAVRDRTEALAAWLSDEDQLLQAFPDASPTKWHRAHTTWFFETFVLADDTPGRAARDYLWNSYYDAIGGRHPRPARGLLSRPPAAEVTAYRRAIDARVHARLEAASGAELAALARVVALGCAHEEQHQELILTDIMAAFARSPVDPRVRPGPPPAATASTGPTASAKASSAPTFTRFDGGIVELGVQADPARLAAFAFDNEGPPHRALLAPFELADRLITAGEVRAFADAGGYREPRLWLSAGAAWAGAGDIRAPEHVRISDDVWLGYSIDGWRPLADDEPAAFLSLYEADAIARWLGGRLPTEQEWEHAARLRHGTAPFTDGNLLVDPATSALRPLPAAGGAPAQLAGDVWEWTSSAYAPYPGYRPDAGALGEYNGKFMINQYVLRGGSAYTPAGHARATYRNFWPADTRFQLTGARVARDVAP
ncbi:MAG TPA: ergothioneine biosynthesis protein EgtB [Kofleriaceae bacterium]|nr:ergothioneine biosynthesis protein EgtB [Kofleriaceae bacterium]